jgi:hypothetical protein
VVIQIVRGHGDAPLATMIGQEWERLFTARRDCIACVDGLDLVGYDPAFRVHLADQAKQHIDAGRLDTIHLLTRSKLVSMGAAVVNLALGSRIRVFSSTQLFDAEVERLGAGAVLMKSKSTA